MRENNEAHDPVVKRDRMAQRVRRLQETVIGNEALGESLDESAANELLSFGMQSVEGIAATTEDMDDETAELSIAERLKALRKLMKHLGRLLGEAQTLDAEGRAWLWNSVQTQTRALYGEGLDLPSLDDVMGRLDRGEAPGQIIAALRNLFESKDKP